MAISTDLIVGFPGETDADAEATEALVRQVKFSQAYSFKYSPRPGTPAADRTDQVPEAIKTERLIRLQALLENQRLAFNRACIGRTLPVLFDKPGRRAGEVAGRSPYLQLVEVELGERRAPKLGDIQDVSITGLGKAGLAGVIKAARP